MCSMSVPDMKFAAVMASIDLEVSSAKPLVAPNHGHHRAAVPDDRLLPNGDRVLRFLVRVESMFAPA